MIVRGGRACNFARFGNRAEQPASRRRAKTHSVILCRCAAEVALFSTVQLELHNHALLTLPLQATFHQRVGVASLPPSEHPNGTYYHMLKQYCPTFPWESSPPLTQVKSMTSYYTGIYISLTCKLVSMCRCAHIF